MVQRQAAATWHRSHLEWNLKMKVKKEIPFHPQEINPEIFKENKDSSGFATRFVWVTDVFPPKEKGVGSVLKPDLQLPLLTGLVVSQCYAVCTEGKWETMMSCERIECAELQFEVMKFSKSRGFFVSSLAIQLWCQVYVGSYVFAVFHSLSGFYLSGSLRYWGWVLQDVVMTPIVPSVTTADCGSLPSAGDWVTRFQQTFSDTVWHGFTMEQGSQHHATTDGPGLSWP